MGPPARKKFAVENPNMKLQLLQAEQQLAAVMDNINAAAAASNAARNNANNDISASSAALTTTAPGVIQAQPPSISASEEIRSGSIQMANELNEFIVSTVAAGQPNVQQRVHEPITDYHALSDSQIIDLQLVTCRKVRELLASSYKEKILQAAQMYNWIPSLLSWLNLHDRAAVQVEALLALTNIAELCAAQQPNFYYPSTNPSTAAAAAAAVTAQQNQTQQYLTATNAAAQANSNAAAVVAAAAAQVAAAAASSSSAANAAATSSTFQEALEAANKYTAAAASAAAAAAAAAATAAAVAKDAQNVVNKYNATSSLAAANAAAARGNVGGIAGLVQPNAVTGGSVPFPPLSFSQTLSPEAVAAFDASLACTIQATASGANKQQLAAVNNNNNNNNNNNINALINTNAALLGGTTGGINFTSLAPPPGGAHNSIGPASVSNLFMPPPPTPAGGSVGFSKEDYASVSTFPQQLSASSQHLLLRHADAIPTLISLLSSPSREVYEQATWILGSIAAGDSPSGSSSSGSNNNSSSNNDRGLSGIGDNNNNNSNNNNNMMKSVSARDVILAAGVMNPLLRCLEAHPLNLSLQRIGAWTLMNLVDGIFQSSSSSAAAAAAAAAAAQNQQNQSIQQQQQQLQAQQQQLQQTTNQLLQQQQQVVQQQQQLLQTQQLLKVKAAAATSGVTGGDGTANNNNYDVTAGYNNTGGTGLPSNSKGIGRHGSNVGPLSMGGEYSSASEIDMSMLLPVLRRLLYITDSEVLSYVCWTLSHLCDGPSSHIAAVVTSIDLKEPKGGLVPRLVELLVHPSWRVTKPALRTIGNIVCAECSEESAAAVSGSISSSNHPGTCGSPATTDYTEVILECGAVPRLKELITHSNREIQKEACWTLSNIAAGTVDQIQAVIDSGAIPPLVNLVRDRKTDQEVRSEACWVVLNATSCGSDAQIEVLVDEGCVSVLGVLLSEASMVMMALEGLERVLQVEEQREKERRELIEAGEIEDDEETRTPILVSAALIEKARDQNSYINSHGGSGSGGGGYGSHGSYNGPSCSAVTKRADRIWKQHFVSCALCKQSHSKHRLSDVMYCEECKCHVCCNCDCKIYHLDYQEELWAMTEFETEAKKNAKKAKNKKKKSKLKEKKQQKIAENATTTSTSKNESGSTQAPGKQQLQQSQNKQAGRDKNATNNEKKKDTSAGGDKRSPSPSFYDDDEDETNPNNPTSMISPGGGADNSNSATNQIDLVLYLQQTGSIIALSKLMDALDYGGDDYDDELDEYEKKMIREQKQLLEQSNQQQ